MKKQILITLTVLSLNTTTAFAADDFLLDESVINSIEEYSLFKGLSTGLEPPLSGLGEGRIYFNSTDNEFKVSENGGAYQPLGAGSNGDFSNGGDTTGAARSLGNNDNFDMSFLVGGNSELYIEGEAGASQGRIGFSDTSPEARLEISGNSSSEDLFMISSDDDNDGDILTIEDTGELGINGSASSISSSALFNVTDGSVLFTGSTGATPVSGAGVRMMWIPSKSAFRAGQSVSTEWDDANIGFGSISMGILTEASGVNSVAIGANSEATGSTSMALGQSSLATNVSSVAIGNATSSGQRSVAIGELVTAGPANDSYVIGRGISQAVQLVNNQQNTLAIGFNSNTPTLFVGASTGAGTTGNVGLGGITSPSTKLDMNGALTMRASSAPTETASRGHIYFDTSQNRFKASQNQNGFVNLIGADPDSNASFPSCNSSRHGQLKVDSASGGGLVYVCDPVRNKWLSLNEMSIYGEENTICGNNQNINSDQQCSIDLGDGLGINGGGLYLARAATITGFGFSSGSSCGGTIDIEAWGSGSSATNDSFINPLSGSPTASKVIFSGITGDSGNANNLNVDIDGNQYVLWGMRNNGCGSISDWNLIVYYRWRHN